MSDPYYRQHWIDIDPERHAAYDQILAFHPALEPILRPLELRPGLRLLDVGSGPAHTTLEIARRIGASGKVTGVDINAEFIARAEIRAREEKLAVKFVRSAFPPLPFPDRSFDRVFCKNVLEYVDSAAATVADMARVTAPGGIVVAVDSDWDMLALDLGIGSDALTDRVLAAAKSIAVKEPKIGRRLFGMFLSAGMIDVSAEIFAAADVAGRSLPMLHTSLARYARDSGRVTAGEVDDWLAQIDRAIAAGRFFFTLPQFVVRGTTV